MSNITALWKYISKKNKFSERLNCKNWVGLSRPMVSLNDFNASKYESLHLNLAQQMKKKIIKIKLASYISEFIKTKKVCTILVKKNVAVCCKL